MFSVDNLLDVIISSCKYGLLSIRWHWFDTTLLSENLNEVLKFYMNVLLKSLSSDVTNVNSMQPTVLQQICVI